MNITIRSRVGALTCALCVVFGNLVTTAAAPAQAGAGWTEITIAASGPSARDAVLEDIDTLIRTSELPAMAAGGSTTFDLKKKQRIKLPNGVSASGKFIIAVVDAGGAVDEGSEGNNAVAAQVP